MRASRDKFSVLLLTRYARDGASSRVRCLNFLSFLEKSGIEVTTAPFFGDDYLGKLHRGERYRSRNLMRDYAKRLQQLMSASVYDLVWIEKEVLPWLPAWLEGVFLRGQPFILDYDDFWSARYTDNRNPMIRLLMPRKLESIALRASAVVVGNPFLARWAREAGARRVVELPTAVDPDHYEVKPLPEGPFTIGWIGSPITENYLRLVTRPLQHMQSKYNARVRIIGANARFSLPGVTLERVAWSEASEAEELSKCHVGIMPLTDGLWEHGKCGYKLVQYMACGRAAVGSAIGINKSIVVNGLTGFLAQTEDEWIGALSALALDPEACRRFGAAGRERVLRNYSIEATAPKLKELLLDVGRRGEPPNRGDTTIGAAALRQA